MIRSDHARAGGGNSSGFYALGCLLAVLLSGCSSPAPVANAPTSAASPPAAPRPPEPPQPPAAAAAPAAVSVGNPERGLELYEARCGACHSLEANRVGPKHDGLFGRTAGKVKDFDYSTALKASKIVWSETTLDAWLADPQALIPGQKMNYAVTNPTDRADIIAYLKAATRTK